MNFVQALVLGVVEGLTEFLPVSSTAHLMIISDLWKISPSDYLKTFEIAIQLGAMMAVVIFFAKKIISEPSLVREIIIGFIPTGVIGFFVYPLVKWLIGYVWVALVALLIGGVFIIFFEKYFHPKDFHLTPQRAFLIGLCQCASFIPGVSRALATITGGMIAGLSRQAAVEFSFLLAIPTVAAATLFDVYKNISLFNSGNWQTLAMGFAAAFVSALLGIKLLLGLSQKANLKWFGVYRIIIALVISAVLLGL
jgi:undecaprenyl-diphosphatase